MEHSSELIDVLNTFLESLRFSPPGGRWQFRAGSKYIGSGGFGLELYVDLERRDIAALKLLRSSYGVKLDGTVEQATEVLSDYFVSEINHLGGGDLMFAAVSNRQGGVWEFVSTEMVAKFAAAFDDYLNARFEECFYLIPMTGLPCLEEINEPNFIWWPWDKDLGEIADRFGFSRSGLVSGQFPPLGRDVRVTPLFKSDSWLGCFATHDAHGEGMLRRIAGALFLGLDLSRSLMISAAKQPAGLFVVRGRNCEFSLKPSPLPHLIQPVPVTTSVVDFVRKVIRAAASNRRLAVALECCGAAWNQPERERFMQLCVALDALFGIKGQVAKSIREGVKMNAKGVSEAEERCRLLLSMRNDLLHGDSFALAQCMDYLEYNERFGVRPSRDQVSLLRACVWNLASDQK